MSDGYIPPFPTGNNSSSETNYTQAFEKARENRNKQTGPTEPEPVKPKTPQHHHSTKPKPAKPNHSLINQGSGSSKSGGSNNSSSRSGSSHNGSSRSSNPSHQSPKPGRSRREKEGHIGSYSNSPYNNNNMGYNSPYNNNAGRKSEHGRNKKKQGGQTPLHDGILPPFPTGTDTGSNYTEMFNRYHKDNMSPNAPVVQTYQPTSEIPTHKTGCCCIM